MRMFAVLSLVVALPALAGDPLAWMAERVEAAGGCVPVSVEFREDWHRTGRKPLNVFRAGDLREVMAFDRAAMSSGARRVAALYYLAGASAMPTDFAAARPAVVRREGERYVSEDAEHLRRWLELMRQGDRPRPETGGMYSAFYACTGSS